MSVASDVFNSLAVIIGALATITTAVLSVRVTRKRMIDACDKRIEDLAKAFRAGLALADERPKRKVR